MRIYTVHTRDGRAPVLVREGFSFWALLFGPLWLLACGAWIPALILLAADAVVGRIPGAAGPVLDTALAVLVGLCGRDLLRWSLAWRDYAEVHVIAAPNVDMALARLLEMRPDLVGDAAGPVSSWATP